MPTYKDKNEILSIVVSTILIGLVRKNEKNLINLKENF